MTRETLRQPDSRSPERRSIASRRLRHPRDVVAACQPVRMDSEAGTHSYSGRERVLAARAIEEARRSPSNTRVRVVIARGDVLLGTGFKGELRGLHAEEVALRRARAANADLVGAELFATLEPCANSRTARVPCAE